MQSDPRPAGGRDSIHSRLLSRPSPFRSEEGWGTAPHRTGLMSQKGRKTLFSSFTWHDMSLGSFVGRVGVARTETSGGPAQRESARV